MKTRINVEESEATRAGNDESSTSESSFGGMINTKTWRIRRFSDPITLLSVYHNAIKRALIDLLTKSTVKFYIIITITMVRKDKEGVKERTAAYFHGSTRILLRASQIPEMLQSSAEKKIPQCGIKSRSYMAQQA